MTEAKGPAGKRKGELIGADYSELKTSASFPGGILIAPGGPAYRPRAVINTTPAIKRTEGHRGRPAAAGGCRESGRRESESFKSLKVRNKLRRPLTL